MIAAISCLAVFAFNLWVLVNYSIDEFGEVTRGDFIMISIVALILPAGLLIALATLFKNRYVGWLEKPLFTKK